MPPTSSSSSSSSAQAGPSSIPLCTLPRPTKRVRRDEGQDAGEEEGDEPPTYRLLELPDEIAGMIEEAQRARDGGQEVEEGDGGGGKGIKRGRAAGKEAAVPHLIINGRHSDPAVLCTPTRTYALRQVTQSNSLLLCSLPSPHSSTSTTTPRLTLRSNVTDILELQPVVPRLERIAELLEGSAYAGEDEEERKGRRRLYTVRELRSVVQASDEEMMRGLDEICVLRLDGYLRLLSPTYLLTLIDSLLLICSSNSYLPHAIPLHECVDALMADYGERARREIFEAVLTRWFGEEKEKGVVELDGRKVARFVGLELLKLKERSGSRKGGGSSSDAISRLPLLDDFMAEWRMRLGDVFSTSHRGGEGGLSSTTTTTTHGLVDLSLLRGQFLLHTDPLSGTATTTNPKRTTSTTSSRPAPPLRQRISYYPSSHLPLEPAARFQSLFTTRAQWQLDDLLPFIEDVAPEAKRREALLLRFARAKKMPQGEGGGMVYSSRVRY